MTVSCLGAQLPDDPGILSDLIAELLVHSNNHGVGLFDVLESSLECLVHLPPCFNLAPGRKNLVDQTRFAGRLDCLEHPRRVTWQINLTQGNVVPEQLDQLIARASSIE